MDAAAIVDDATPARRTGRGWPKGRPSPRKGMKLGPVHRTSPKRQPRTLPCPPEVRAEILRVMGPGGAEMLPLTKVKEVLGVLPLAAELKGVTLSLLNDAWGESCEGRGKSYADIARETESSRRITVDRVAELEAYGVVHVELTKVQGRPRWNGFNVFRLQIPPYLLAVLAEVDDGTKAGDELHDQVDEDIEEDTANDQADEAPAPPAPFVPRAAWSPEVNAIGAILTQHAGELPVGVEAFAPKLWSFAQEKTRKYSLTRVLVGIEQAASKAEGERGKQLRRFIKGCIEHLNDGANVSPEVKAAVRAVEAARAALVPPPEPRRVAAGASLAAGPPPPAAPASEKPARALCARELLSYCAEARTYEQIAGRWPSSWPDCNSALNKLLTELQAKAWLLRRRDGRYQATSGGLEAAAGLPETLATGPP